MSLRISLLLVSAIIFGIFILLSYTVAKEYWQQIDFDTMVKLQDHVSPEYDGLFSYFSLIGSVELTFLLVGLFSLASLIKKRWLAFFAWLLIIPATIVEVFGKLVLFHPAPPFFFHRTIVAASLPSFEVNTNFSYPSGHITRTVFLVTTFLLLIFLSKRNGFSKIIWLMVLLGLAMTMMFTRIYLGEHWLSDVLGGVLLGGSFGAFAAALIIRKHKHG